MSGPEPASPTFDDFSSEYGNFQLPISSSPEPDTPEWHPASVSVYDTLESPQTPAPSHANIGDQPDEFEESEEEDYAEVLERERAAKHAGYLSNRSNHPPSIVGAYVVDCEQLEKGWDNTDYLRLSIMTTPLPGIYQAAFNFGILEGIMMLSADEHALSFFSEKEIEEIAGDDDRLRPELATGPEQEPSQTEEENTHEDSAGRKRKAVDDTSRPAKVMKTEDGFTPLVLHLCMRSRDTGSGQINPNPELGVITFNEQQTEFKGTVDIDPVGRDVSLRARKISDTAEKPKARWEDYGHAAYEYARIARWH